MLNGIIKVLIGCFSPVDHVAADVVERHLALPVAAVVGGVETLFPEHGVWVVVVV